MTALSFAFDDLPGPPLPHEWDADRRQLIEEMDLESLPHHTRWRAEEILKRMAVSDPDVFEAWFSRRVVEMRERGFYHSPEPHGVDRVVGDSAGGEQGASGATGRWPALSWTRSIWSTYLAEIPSLPQSF